MPGGNPCAPIRIGADTRRFWKTILLTILCFAAVALVIYYPSLRGEFVFDDGIIQENPIIHITRLSQLTDLLFSKAHDRRIGLSSFALNYYFGGFDTFGYHLINVIIHILNGGLLFLLSHTILTLCLDEKKGRGNAFTIAFLGSFIWLVHPIQTQAVSYVVQRLTSLSSLFFLLSLLFYMKGRVIHSSKGVFCFLLSLLFGMLALGTKQNAATLPIFIVLSEFFFFQPQSFKMDKKKLGFILLLVGLFVLISWMYLGSDVISRLAQQYEKREWTPIERVMTQWRVIIFYISLLIYPHPSRLNLDHDFAISHSLFSPPTTILSLLFIIGSLWLAIVFVRRNRLLAFAIFWFFGNLVIESSIIPLELVFEHRLYLPSMGLIMLLTGFYFHISKREWERGVTVLMILLIALLSYWTYERASVWRGQLSIWMDASKKSPNKARPYNNLATAYDKKGFLEEAVAELKKSLMIKPDSAEAHTNLGVAYYKKGMLDKAISEHKEAISINPNFADAYTNLGIAYGRKRLFDEAIAEFKQALVYNPNDARACYNLGYAYSKKGLLDDAISWYQKAIAINPYYTKAYHKLGSAFKAQGKLNDVIGSYRELIRLEPGNHEIYNELAWMHATSSNATIRNGDEAVVLATRACELTGFKKSEALDTLAAAYAEQGKFNKAVEYQSRAIELAPEDASSQCLPRCRPHRAAGQSASRIKSHLKSRCRRGCPLLCRLRPTLGPDSGVYLRRH